MYKELCSFQPRINHLQPDTNQTQAGHQPDTEEEGGEVEIKICTLPSQYFRALRSALSRAPISASGHSAYRFATACSVTLVRC
jgi:hypothetical protein